MVTEISLEKLREELGVEFPSKNRWKQVKASITLDWLMRDAGLSERQKKAVERYLQGEKSNRSNLYWGMRKLKDLVKSMSNSV